MITLKGKLRRKKKKKKATVPPRSLGGISTAPHGAARAWRETGATTPPVGMGF